jgi:hypothetical protein
MTDISHLLARLSFTPIQSIIEVLLGRLESILLVPHLQLEG